MQSGYGEIDNKLDLKLEANKQKKQGPFINVRKSECESIAQ